MTTDIIYRPVGLLQLLQHWRCMQHPRIVACNTREEMIGLVVYDRSVAMP